MTGSDAKRPAIRIAAHVLVQLGEELVTDVEQAILECVKNAYDADSPGCKIKIDSSACGVETHTGTAGELLQFYHSSEGVDVSFTFPDGRPIPATAKGIPKPLNDDTEIVRKLQWKGCISIEDGGDGISPEGIKGSWLVISNSAKRVPNGKKKKTVKGRTPLGDKGLGRLGSMKLGDVLLVESAQAAQSSISSALFRWADCDRAHTVDEIPVRVLENIPNRKKFKGTKVSVLGLHELGHWNRPGRALEITKSLARLISPFEAKSQFPVTVDVNGHKASLVAVTDTLLSRAIAEFHFIWKLDEDGEMALSCNARFREKLFRPTKGSASQQQKARAVFADGDGSTFFKWLPTAKKMKRFSIKPRPSKEWFIELSQSFKWKDLAPTDDLPTIDPGELSGAFYYFHLNEVKEDTLDDSEAELDVDAVAGLGIDKTMVKEMAGVSVLRDGFRVRSTGDWLKMSEGMTSGSTYNLRYHNTLGYFALTGEHNDGLVEKSDREGFVENSAYRGFLSIAETCKAFSNDAIENIRRAQDDYARNFGESEDDTPPTPERSLSIVNESLALAASAQKSAKSVVDTLNQSIAIFEKGIVGSSAESKKKAVDNLKEALTTASSLQRNLASGARASSAVKVLSEELSDSKERMISLYESAAVGLSARGLAHELRTHLIEIRKRATALENAIKSGKSSETAIMPHLRAIRASCGSISNAASLIDPMLPRARAVKETIDLHQFIDEYISHRKHALDQEDIGFELKVSSSCVVKMNRGRLLQVLDNLMRNSFYWLRRGTQTLGIERDKKILIAISRKGFSIADSGPGVDPRYEDSIFEMFVSAKPAKERGQGLGLFIITQLLAADGAQVYLAPDRNPDGRRYKFVVNLSSVVEER